MGVRQGEGLSEVTTRRLSVGEVEGSTGTLSRSDKEEAGVRELPVNDRSRMSRDGEKNLS